MNAAIYARYSSDNQREASIDDQLRICRDYCKQKGLTVVCEYHDSALSGLTDNRPDFQRMIRDGERRVFDCLVLYSLDRFARNKYDSATYKARLKKAGVVLAYVTTPVGEGPESVLMESLLEGMAQYYSENLARNVRRGLEGNALKGVWASGHVPIGYKLDESKHLTIDPIAAETVRLIYTLYADGHPRAAIMRRLNLEHRLTSTGKPWNGGAITHILKNPIYTGVYKYGSIVNPTAAPVIIEKPLFDRVQSIIAINAQARARHIESAAPYLLTGKLMCGCCGAWMVGMSGVSHSGKIYYYYACSRKSHNKGGCPKLNEPRDAVDNAIIAAVKTTLTDPVILDIAQRSAAQFAAESDNTPAIKQATAALSSINRKINNLLDAVEQGIISETLQSRLSELESQRTSAQTALARAQIPAPTPTAAEIAFYLKSLRDTDPASPAYRSALVSNLLNTAVIYDTPAAEGKKIAVAYNLTQPQSETLDSSSINKKVGLIIQSSNPPEPYYLIDRCAVFIRSYHFC